MSQAAGLPDLSYTPGDLTEPEYRLPSHQLLLDQKRASFARDNNEPLSRLYLDREETQPIKYRDRVTSATGRQFPALAAAQSRYTDNLERSSDLNGGFDTGFETDFVPGKDLISLPVAQTQRHTSDTDPDLIRKMPLHSITEKPNERCPSPVGPAYANFQLAKRMLHDNLHHLPLPDCEADLAFRKAQISGVYAGLSLEIDPIATGVGVKTHNAGPTHCTKMKVFRPKTGGGVVPKDFGVDCFDDLGSAPDMKKEPLDLDDCWDLSPAIATDEPRLARHIDGSADFFDKDILRRKRDFGGRAIDREDPCACDYSPPPRDRARSVSRDSSAASHCRRGPGAGVSFCNLAELSSGSGGGGGGTRGGMPPNRLAKQYQSSPLLGDKAYQALREKYLGPESSCEGNGPGGVHMEHGCRPAGPSCKRDTVLRRPARRLCHKVGPAPAPRCCPPAFGHGHGHGHGHCLTSKAAFRAGVAKHNASGDFMGMDTGCSGGGRVLVVPRPRQPYAKKNYDIDTLVPPFRSQGGGAGQGGYPEHWRLASVYQHAFKPLEQRRRPLLQTVYK
ncbi:GL14557 [Drosophila persimilis]|uniref:GL14557 n=1 Tax=Drosophila persimilis TaxID=7234 RepID=B4GW17_DROPE|nr:GL14557 [Drosophila persimilis]